MTIHGALAWFGQAALPVSHSFFYLYSNIEIHNLLPSCEPFDCQTGDRLR